jgi:Sensors of blue-light using FAD
MTSIADEPGFRREGPLLYNLVYCSRAAPGVGDAAVDAIIATARRCNPAHGITGMLVFGSGIFFQWLEGPRDAVLRLMGLIAVDPRHMRVVQLSAVEESRERLFPDWDMERVQPDHIREVLMDAIDAADDPNNAAALRTLLIEVEATALLSRS